MPKKIPPKQYNTADMQPDELNALRALVKEFVGIGYFGECSNRTSGSLFSIVSVGTGYGQKLNGG